MKNIKKYTSIVLASAGLLVNFNLQAAVINPVEDVMTSGFFQGSNTVRGYSGDNRNTHRVSTNNPFGTAGAETLYLNFDANDFASYSSTVSAQLTLQSSAGGFGFDADSSNPFLISAHAVSADPITAIVDDTNPAGTTDWLTFFNTSILAADASAMSHVDSFGSFTIDISTIVNDWISGSNSIFTIAITGKNDTSGNSFLHGFLNNTENPGSSFISVNAVPVPAAVWLFASALIGLVTTSRRT